MYQFLLCLLLLAGGETTLRTQRISGHDKGSEKLNWLEVGTEFRMEQSSESQPVAAYPGCGFAPGGFRIADSTGFTLSAIYHLNSRYESTSEPFTYRPYRYRHSYIRGFVTSLSNAPIQRPPVINLAPGVPHRYGFTDRVVSGGAEGVTFGHGQMARLGFRLQREKGEDDVDGLEILAGLGFFNSVLLASADLQVSSLMDHTRVERDYFGLRSGFVVTPAGNQRHEVSVNLLWGKGAQDRYINGFVSASWLMVAHWLEVNPTYRYSESQFENAHQLDFRISKYVKDHRFSLRVNRGWYRELTGYTRLIEASAEARVVIRRTVVFSMEVGLKAGESDRDSPGETIDGHQVRFGITWLPRWR